MKTEPLALQVFLGKPVDQSDIRFSVNLYMARKEVTKRMNTMKETNLYICSLSQHTIVYKGQLTCAQLSEYYLDLVSIKFILF